MNIDVNSTLLTIKPAVFVGGDESFTVSYDGKTSDPVALDKVVENLVTIEPKFEFTAAQLALFSSFNNYSVDENGKVTFTYLNNLGANGLTLPTLTATDYDFKGWRYLNADGTLGGAITKISNDSGSLNIKAEWEGQLVKVSSMAFENRVKDGVTVSYLVIKGKFVIAEDVFLYLYEGNDKVALDGTRVEGNRDDDFELLFDLKDLADANYVGKWMDIRFKATINGVEEEMQIYASDPSITVDLGETVQNPDGNGYYFMTYTSNGNTTLKVVNRPINYTYSAQFVEESGVTKLRIEGTVLSSDLYNKTIYILWDTEGSERNYATISATGTWSIATDLSELPTGTNIWAHIGVLDGVDGEVLLADEDLAIAACSTSMPPVTPVGEIEKAIVFTNTRGFKYYFGHRGWDANKLYIIDDRYAVTDIELKEVEGEAHLVISGRYLVNEETAEILETLVLNLLYVEGNYLRNEYDKESLTLDDGRFSFTVNLSELEGLGNYFFHLGVGSGNQDNLHRPNISGSITVAGRVYTLVPSYADWNGSAVKISEGEIAVTSIDLKEIDGKVYVEVKGTHSGKAAEILEDETIFDLQFFENGWTTFHFEDIITINEDGTFVVLADISEMTSHKYTVHLHYGQPDGNLYVEGAGNIVSANGRTYVLYDRTTNPWGGPWGTASIVIIEDKMAVTDMELKEIDGKASVVISGVYNLETEDADVIASFVLDIQRLEGDWATTVIENGFELDLENGTFSYTIDLSDVDVADHMFHFKGTSLGDNMFVPHASGSITVDGRTYTIVVNIRDWFISGVSVTTAE